MASSDIIKIGFDYRSSLAQFEKDTNGVFDGISSKAGKQKITIQLDAKDDKVIDKIKELQKLKLDKFTFEFGNSGLKEQLQTFDKLENKINEIINLSKGIDNSSTPIVDVNKSSKEIDKLESKLSELSKKYEELQKGNISGKDINLVDNDEFKKLSESFEKVKGEVDDLKTHMSLLGNNTISEESFVKLSSQVDGLSTKLDGLLGKYDKLADAQKNLGAETNISSGLKDAIQGDNSSADSVGKVETKLDDAVISAKELDKALDGVNVPTDTFDTILSKLNRTKSELIDIVKITKSWVSDTEGKGHEAYTLKDSRGSSEIYGVSSKTDKGQILRQNIVQYDKSKDNVDNKKAELEVDKQLAKEEEELAKAQQKKAQAFQKEQTDYENEQKKVDALAKQKAAYDELMNTIKQYSEVAKRVAGGNAEDDDIDKMSKLEDKISQLQKQPILSSSQVEKSEKSLVSLYDQLDKIERKLVETNQKSQDKQIAGFDKRISGYESKLTNYQATADKFKGGGWTSDAYKEQIDKLNKAIGEYKTLLASMQNDSGLVTDKNIEQLNKYESEIKEVISTVSNMSATEKGFTKLDGQKTMNWISQQLRDNSKMSREAKNQIKAYYAQIKSGNPTMSLAKIRAEVLEIINAEEQAGRAGKSMFDAIKEKAWYGVASAIGTYFGFNDILRYGGEAINIVREFNTALTEMRKVSNETVQSLKDYQATTFDTADAVGTTAKQIQNSTADWMRLGESMSEAATSAKDANILLNVSEFDSIDEATESLVSMSQAYKDLDKMDIIDVLNNIGNNYSISTDGLATALKDSASALVTANNDLNSAVALTTAGKFITWIYRNIYQRMNLIAGNALEPCTTI